MVLDEPTNDLDLETLDLLQETIADYDGTVLIVSHDRDFLDKTVTSVIASEGEGRWIEYAGGYSDMVAQRGQGVTAKSAVRADAAPRAEAEPARPARERARKLSFNEKRALETLPAEIERLQRAIAASESRLADPSLYARDPKAFDEAGSALAAARAALDEAETRWLELEMLREEVGG